MHPHASTRLWRALLRTLAGPLALWTLAWAAACTGQTGSHDGSDAGGRDAGDTTGGGAQPGGGGTGAGDGTGGTASGAGGVATGSGGSGGTGDTGVGPGASVDPGPLPALCDGATRAPADLDAADFTFELDLDAGRHWISPHVYGMNGMPDDGLPTGTASFRYGGNRWTAYNWESNASNAGEDWMHQNDAYLGGGEAPGEAVRMRVEAAHAGGASALVTVPIIGRVAADKDGPVSEGAQSTRFHLSQAYSPGGAELPPSTVDDVVYQDAFVTWLEASFPDARGGAGSELFYSLDNEPDLWGLTHPLIEPDDFGYQSLTDRNIEYAGMIKALSPAAVVFGPVHYGYQGYVNLQGAADAGGREFMQYYLEAVRAASDAAGHRLVDVFDVHWYPEASGGGVRIIGDDASPAVAAARIQAPRSLWDPSYQEDSWIADCCEGALELLPTLQARIDASYPGTRLAITEYYYGGGEHISGALAQADVLGIFGRHDVFAAHLWRLGGGDHRFIWGGFAMFRDYDGQGGHFGDVSVEALTDDPAGSAVYAALDSRVPGRLTVVAINRDDTPRTAALRIRGGCAFSQFQQHRLTSASATPVAAGSEALGGDNAVRLELPALSVTTLVFDP